MDAEQEIPAEVARAAAAVDRALARLLTLLKSPEEAVWRGAIAALDGLGVAAIGLLTLGLDTGKDPAHRVRIVEALGTLAPTSRTTVLLALAGAMRDPDIRVREAALRVTWGIPSIHSENPRPGPAGARSPGLVDRDGGSGAEGRSPSTHRPTRTRHQPKE